MTGKWSQFFSPAAATGALAGALVSAFISGGINYFAQNKVAQNAQLRNMQLESIVEFSSSNEPLIALAGEYVQAVVKGDDVTPIRVDLRAQIGQRIRASDNLKTIFPRSQDGSIEAYQAALEKFAQALKDANDPLTMSRGRRV